MLAAALSNGDEAEVDMKIGTEWYSDDVSCIDGVLNTRVIVGSEALVQKYILADVAAGRGSLC